MGALSKALRELADDLEDSDACVMAYAIGNEEGYTVCGDIGNPGPERYFPVFLFTKAIAAMNNEMAEKRLN